LVRVPPRPFIVWCERGSYPRENGVPRSGRSLDREGDPDLVLDHPG
jgi:hypothetical protein